MIYLPVVECVLLGLGIVLVGIPLILKACESGRLGSRTADLHHTQKVAVPRLGGLALAAAFVGIELFIILFYGDHRDRVTGRNIAVISPLLMFGLGFWDDLRPLGAKRKLLGQVLIALLVCVFGLSI